MRISPKQCALGFIRVGTLLAMFSIRVTARVARPSLVPAPGLVTAQAAADCWAVGQWRSVSGSTVAADRWTWVPTRRCSLPLPPLTRTDWCRVHDGHRLLIVGDSLSLQHMRATIRLAGPATEPGGGPIAERLEDRTIRCATRKDLYPYQPGCITARVCDGRVAVGYVRNDHLLDVRGRMWRPYPANVLMHQWRSALDLWKPTHVILNRGAHYVRDERFRKGLEEALELVARLAPRARVILRSTPPGHANCFSFTSPIVTPLPPTRYSRLYHWDDFRRQDRIMREVALASHTALFLDVSTATALRPDGHAKKTDCLHYNNAMAPIFTWVRLAGAAVEVMDELQSTLGHEPFQAPTALARRHNTSASSTREYSLGRDPNRRNATNITLDDLALTTAARQVNLTVA